MQRLYTVVLKSVDRALEATAGRALSELDGYRVIYCRDDRSARKCLDEVEADLILYDHDRIVPEADCVVIASRTSHPRCARILLLDPQDAKGGIELSKRAAAFMFLHKPIDDAMLSLVVKRALEQAELSRRHRILSRELNISLDDEDLLGGLAVHSIAGGYSRFERIVYASPKMAELVAEAKIAAGTNMPVLIHGDTGTGKELLARAIHFNSDRMNSPMHVQNCGGLPDAILHSELFGHVRGAFNGALSDRPGLFRAADGGTVFLDEISEISPAFQVALLRFLQEGEVKPLGSDKMLHSDVRIIAASNKPVAKLVERGAFRRDLYYRLRGFDLEIPPLRQRPEDIPVLTQFFVEKYAGVVGRRVLGVTSDALRKLESYSFPGNVRELETEVKRMVAVAEQGGYIAVRHLTEKIARLPLSEAGASIVPFGGTLRDMVEGLERRVILDALNRLHWNQSRAADELGLSRVGLSNKIRRYDLQRGQMV